MHASVHVIVYVHVINHECMQAHARVCICSLVPQTLWSQGAYRLEIISARSKRVWCNAYTFFVQRIAKSRDC